MRGRNLSGRLDYAVVRLLCRKMTAPFLSWRGLFPNISMKNAHAVDIRKEKRRVLSMLMCIIGFLIATIALAGGKNAMIR